MTEDRQSYLKRRRKEELAAAEQATNPVAADIHRSLAARYRALADEPLVRSL